jgi:hypothetical protein
MNEMVEAIVSQLIPTLSNTHTHMEIIIAVMTLVEKYASMSGKEKESLAINALEAITICAAIHAHYSPAGKDAVESAGQANAKGASSTCGRIWAGGGAAGVFEEPTPERSSPRSFRSPPSSPPRSPACFVDIPTGEWGSLALTGPELRWLQVHDAPLA